jgi:hypothetical protein
MSLSDIVDVTITTQTTAPSRVGFGTPLVLAYHNVFPERVREYENVAAMITDGFPATHKAVLAATALFAQNPAPDSIIVGREALTDPMDVNLEPVTAGLLANTAYTLVIDGNEVSYTTDATPTVAEITAAWKTAIDLLGLNVTVTDNSTDLDIVADSVDDNFSIYTDMKPAQVLMLDNTPDGGIVTDLTAIIQENNDFYSVHPTILSKAVITALAANVETLTKICVTSSMDSAILDSGSTTDVAAALQTAGYARTALLYHPKANVQFAGCAWAGKNLPKDPGSVTWKFKTLAGVDYVDMTPTEVTNAENKDCNTYIRIAGVSMTEQGVTAAGEFIDITRGIDFIDARMQEYIFSTLANSDKVPFTDAGISQIEAQVRAVLDLSIGNGILAADPEPTVTVPKAADVSTTDKANRLLPDVEFTGTLAGAIHKVVVTGTVSV